MRRKPQYGVSPFFPLSITLRADGQIISSFFSLSLLSQGDCGKNDAFPFFLLLECVVMANQKIPSYLSAEQRQALMEIPSDLSERDLARYYSFTQEELKLINSLYWLLGTSVRKVDGFAFDCFRGLTAPVLHR
jgi:Domain of unknown function (DUF4158)